VTPYIASAHSERPKKSHGVLGLSLNLLQMQKKRKDPIASGEDESTQDELIVKEKLTLKQELFCQNYVINDVFRGNATLSYADAY